MKKSVIIKHSLIKKLICMLVIQCTILLAVFISYTNFFYSTIEQGLEDNAKNFIQMYGKELKNKLDNADMLLERLIYKNNDYSMLQSENESSRYYASINLKKFIQEQITYDPYVDAVVIAESSYGNCLDYDNLKLTFQDREDLRTFTKEKSNKNGEKAIWKIEKIGNNNYIYKMYVWRGRATGVFILINHFMENVSSSNYENMNILLLDKQQRIWGCYGEMLEGISTGQVWEEGQFDRKGSSYELVDDSITVYAGVGISEIFNQMKWNMILIFAGIFLLVLFSGVMIYFLRTEVIFPMSYMQKSMEEIKKGNYALRIHEDYKNDEFRLLKEVFNGLMDEILNLKIDSYEKLIAFHKAELKSIKLQIRPHFFLNAMTTISSLSYQKKYIEIQTYISALSKNIRYMFQAGLHTVELREEIQHVENYFEMQQLKYPNCVFYYIDIPQELQTWRIPQMILHTIIENEYKYAVAVDCVLTILIKGSLVEKNGKEYLCLEVEDDGKGYPEEVLESFMNEEGNHKGERVGLWSIKKMMYLMYEEHNLFVIDNITPHGCKNYFYIPKEVVHEFEEQNIVTFNE